MDCARGVTARKPNVSKSAAQTERSRASVSACLIVQDEERHITTVLESVSFCDEMIVVDGGSRDRTVELARASGARVIENCWPGYAAQRNVALHAATGDWVLEIDADERVSKRLRTSVEALLADPPEGAAIALCALRNRFLGRELGPSAKYPAYRSRLFRRGIYRHDESRDVHEGIEPRERPVLLDGDLEHELAAGLGEALGDAWSYARLESCHIRRPSGVLAYLKGIALRPTAKLAYRVFVDEGWRDGWQGLLKIGLDACSDALVWTRVLLKALGAHQHCATERDPSPATGRHFGRRPSGPPKVVALAARGKDAEAATRWLLELRARGVDVALISDGHTREEEIPARHVSVLRPFATMRALDVEMQVRTIQAVVPFGWRARLVWRALPRTLRPQASLASTDG